MPKYLFILIFILPQLVNAQAIARPDTSSIKNNRGVASGPAYFLDSQSIDMGKTFIDVENIESITVVKDNTFDAKDSTRGEVFITSKNKMHHWITLADFKTKNPDNAMDLPIAYAIDGKLISDTSNIRFEASIIESIDIVNSKDSNSIYYDGSPKTVFVITTKQNSKEK
ncbi:MAG: hypothetical protein ACHQEM_07685 [Chitinophagales bacterium]